MSDFMFDWRIELCRDEDEDDTRIRVIAPKRNCAFTYYTEKTTFTELDIKEYIHLRETQ